MSELLDRRNAIRRILPAGPDQADDAAIVATGTVYAVDPVGATVQVGVRDGLVTVPAVADRYVLGGLARVLIDPIKARPVLVVGAVGASLPTVLATVTAVGASTITISWGSSGTVDVVTTGGVYTAGQSAWVSTDEWGTPFLAVAPSSVGSAPVVTVTPPVVARTVVATASIGPQVTGTWRASMSRWDQWNPGRYGLGNTPIYQGNAYGSGTLVGFAGYGNQIVNLRAISILSITMSARKGSDGNSAALVVQGSPSGTRPGGSPSSSGDTATTGSIASGGTGSLAFTTNMCTAFRTGAAKGLAAIGSQYGGFAGYGVPPSFVLHIRYTKNA